MIVFATLSFHVPRAAAFDWDPITDAEKSMKSNPLDPGAGEVVLFKRGEIDVLEKQSLFWTTRIQTYARIKVFNDAGREAANVSGIIPLANPNKFPSIGGNETTSSPSVSLSA